MKEASIPDNLFTVHGKEVEAILHHAVREALLRHKKLGQSVAVWRDGEVVILSAEEIPVEDENGAVPRA
ncbi:MAG: hypothetical protein AAB401_13650 [Acidobacteriota bacterium]